mmetsp:Transcript_20955/g.54517  ORF Transcript_20955/g.54517 Transcript_20955/m.54517 type:complete len:361 (-) Transcript_20955:515-1597(-)
MLPSAGVLATIRHLLRRTSHKHVPHGLCSSVDKMGTKMKQLALSYPLSCGHARLRWIGCPVHPLPPVEAMNPKLCCGDHHLVCPFCLLCESDVESGTSRLPYDEGKSCWGNVFDIRHVRLKPRRLQGELGGIIDVISQCGGINGQVKCIHEFRMGKVALRYKVCWSPVLERKLWAKRPGSTVDKRMVDVPNTQPVLAVLQNAEQPKAPEVAVLYPCSCWPVWLQFEWQRDVAKSFEVGFSPTISPILQRRIRVIRPLSELFDGFPSQKLSIGTRRDLAWKEVATLKRVLPKVRRRRLGSEARRKLAVKQLERLSVRFANHNVEVSRSPHTLAIAPKHPKDVGATRVDKVRAVYALRYRVE